MNAKQVFPIVATLSPEIISVMPPLLIIGGLVALTVWLFSDDDKNEPENAPAKVAPKTKPLPIPPNFGKDSAESHGIAPNPGGKLTAIPALAAIPSNSTSATAKLPAQPTFSTGKTAPATSATERQRLRVSPASGVTPTQSAPSTVPAGPNPPASKIPVPPMSVVPAVKTTPPIPPAAQKKSIARADMAKIFNGGTRGLTRKSAVAALKALGFGKTAAYEALAINGRFMSWLQFAPDGIITWKE